MANVVLTGANGWPLNLIAVCLMRGMSALLAAAALVGASPGLALQLGARHPRVARSHAKLGDWRLDVARNGFTGEIACRLHRHDNQALFMVGAAGWRFDRNRDVSAAVYRIDGGAPLHLRDDLPRLIARGVPIDRRGRADASGGTVWIPYARLAEANSVAIATGADRAPKSFHLRGLTGLYDIAQAGGCASDSRFVER